MNKAVKHHQKAAEAVAIQALSFLAQDDERLGQFLALSGVGPGDIRTAANQPGFLAGVLDHIVGDEALLVAFAAHADLAPTQVAAAHSILSGERHWGSI
jgi:hypothetical protein